MFSPLCLLYISPPLFLDYLFVFRVFPFHSKVDQFIIPLVQPPTLSIKVLLQLIVPITLLFRFPILTPRFNPVPYLSPSAQFLCLFERPLLINHSTAAVGDPIKLVQSLSQVCY